MVDEARVTATAINTTATIALAAILGSTDKYYLYDVG